MHCQNNDQKACVIYARVSTDDQAEKYGLASQIRETTGHAERHGYSVVEICSDEGYSGENLDRPGMARLRELVKLGAANVVLAYEPDRVTRNLGHQLLLQEEFEAAGIQQDYVTLTVSNNHEGKLLLTMKGAIAEYEKEKIKERTMRGRKEKARQGFIVGGRRTFGYKCLNGMYQPDDTEANVVRTIFKWFVEEGI